MGAGAALGEIMSDGVEALGWWMRGGGVQDAVLVHPLFKAGIGGGGLLHCVVAVVLEKVGAVVVVIATLCVIV